MPYTIFYSGHCIRIEVKVKQNVHRIWIAMEKPLKKRCLAHIEWIQMLPNGHRFHIYNIFVAITVSKSNLICGGKTVGETGPCIHCMIIVAIISTLVSHAFTLMLCNMWLTVNTDRIMAQTVLSMCIILLTCFSREVFQLSGKGCYIYTVCYSNYTGPNIVHLRLQFGLIVISNRSTVLLTYPWAELTAGFYFHQPNTSNNCAFNSLYVTCMGDLWSFGSFP